MLDDGVQPRSAASVNRWIAAEVVAASPLTASIRSIILKPTRWPGHVAGQHVQVRLIAPDGYSAQRDYSITSAPSDDGLIELAIENLSDGEVSPFLHDALAPGDRIEIRGPIGGHFVWRHEDGGPVLLIAGGSGLAPLMAMLRARRMGRSAPPMTLLMSARRWSEIPFRDELLAIDDIGAASVGFLLTRDEIRRPQDHAGRIMSANVEAAISPWRDGPRHVFVCGSNGFVEAAASACLAAGIDHARVRTERFGAAKTASRRV
jgi:glycine betaine catabolism B